jgi:hypothetical protein
LINLFLICCGVGCMLVVIAWLALGLVSLIADSIRCLLQGTIKAGYKAPGEDSLREQMRQPLPELAWFTIHCGDCGKSDYRLRFSAPFRCSYCGSMLICGERANQPVSRP